MIKAKRKATATYHLGVRECDLEIEKLRLKLKDEASQIGEATEYNQIVQGVLIRYVEILKDGYLFYVSYKHRDYIYTVPDINLTANATLAFKRRIDQVLEQEGKSKCKKK